MPRKTRRLEYFYFLLDDRPGEATRVLAKLKDARVNLLSFIGFPTGGGRSQLTIVPEDAHALAVAAPLAGLHIAGKKECLLVQGDDQVGAAHDVLKRIADAGINVVAASACAAAGGTFGMVIFVQPSDMSNAEKVLRL